MGQVVLSGPKSWGWGILFTWEGEVFTRNRCGWGRELLIYLVSQLKDGGHGVYTQKFENLLQCIFYVLRRESLFKRFWFEINDRNMSFIP